MTMTAVLENAVDPFSFFTIASVCLGVYRSKFLPEYWSVLTSDNADPLCNHEYAIVSL